MKITREKKRKTPGKGRGTRNKNHKNKNKNSPAFSPVSPSPKVRHISYPDVETAVYDFKLMTAGLDYEICATLRRSHDRIRWVLTIHNNWQPAITTGRDLCTYERYDHIILHNHPGKYYPSVQDIEKVVKNTNMMIGESFIVCKFGVWRFAVKPKNKMPKDVFEGKRKEAQRVSDIFYHATGEGLKYNAKAIQTLCKEITDIYGSRLEFHE
jgi:hypothetical protein